MTTIQSIFSRVLAINKSQISEAGHNSGPNKDRAVGVLLYYDDSLPSKSISNFPTLEKVDCIVVTIQSSGLNTAFRCELQTSRLQRRGRPASAELTCFNSSTGTHHPLVMWLS